MEKPTTEIMTKINEELGKAYAKYEAGQGATYRSQKEVFLAGANSRDAEVERLKEENERLKNDLDDALDLKAGNGPTALSRVIEERDTLKKQISDLASFILRNIPGEPSQNEGAVECAIRIMNTLKKQVEEMRTEREFELAYCFGLMASDGITIDRMAEATTSERWTKIKEEIKKLNQPLT